MRKFTFLLVAALLISAVGASGSPLPVQAASTLSITPSYGAFPNTIVGTVSLPKEFTLKNTGMAEITLGRLYISGNFRLNLGTCTTELILSPNEFCIFSVTFAPLSISYRSGTVYIPTDADNPLYTLSVYGYGTGTNLLKLANFEPPYTTPIPWREGRQTIDFRRLIDCSVWVSPICSVRMRGNSYNPTQTIYQGYARIGEIGDTYVFILSSKASGVPVEGTYRLEIQLLDTYNRQVGYKMLNFRTGTHRWQTLVGSLTASKQHLWIIYRITFKKKAGTAWFDDAILVKLP